MANLSIAHNTRRFDESTNEWVDGKTTFVRATVWGRYGEHVTESLTKGTYVLAVGRLEQQEWQTPEGERRTALQLIVDEIGPALRYATFSVSSQVLKGPTPRTRR